MQRGEHAGHRDTGDDDRKLLFTRRHETYIICPATEDLNHLRETEGHWKKRDPFDDRFWPNRNR